MHRERRVGQGASASPGSVVLALERHIGLGQLLAVWKIPMVLLRILWLRTIPDRPSIAQLSSALSAAIEARTIIVIALADNLATTDNNASMAIMKRRQRSLRKAQRQIGIVARRHYENLLGNLFVFWWNYVI